MLANPVAVPLWADVFVWMCVLPALGIEIWLVSACIRAMGRAVARFAQSLIWINLLTWTAFFLAVDTLDGIVSSGLGMVGVVVALEVGVVLLEAALIRAASRGEVFSHGLPGGELTFRASLALSFIGNLASVAFSLVVPVVLAFVALTLSGHV